MPFPYSILTGKAVQRVARLRGGSGSALPGLVVEKIDPSFMKRTLDTLPYGTVVVTGTNGKTTTTKMVVSLLESQGLKVFTNRTGSNFTRGVTAALIDAVDSSGKLNADIAVLELDEAHAVHFVNQVKPRFGLFLNVLRDQLDRFGEIDATANLLHKVASAITEGVVINRDDPRLASEKFLVGLTASRIHGYGVSSELANLFPSDDAMRGKVVPRQANAEMFFDHTELVSMTDNHAKIRFDNSTHDVTLKLKGIYNVQNAVAAVALVRLVMSEKLNVDAMLESLSQVEPAFGRGETIMVNGQPVELVLVKNPSGFRLSLASFDPTDSAVMIAINDNFADGRDMSWLWDVDFESLRKVGVDTVSGVRAYDMALRLQYDLVDIHSVETDLSTALNEFLKRNPNNKRLIYCSYSAMLALRRHLGKIANVEKVS